MGLGQVSGLALLVLIIAGFGMLVGRGVVMGLLLVLRRVPLAPFFWTSFCCFFTTLPGLLVHCLQVFFPYSIVLLSLPLVLLFWTLPVRGHVAGLITDGVRAAQVGEAAVVSRTF